MPPNTPLINPPTVFVCTTCGADKSVPFAARDGQKLLDSLTKIKDGRLPVRVQRVKCFGGCNHPCAVAFAAAGKITYMYGNLPVADEMLPETIAQTLAYAELYARSANGYVAPHDKPPLFRDVLVRIPDANWASDTGVVTAFPGEADPAGFLESKHA